MFNTILNICCCYFCIGLECVCQVHNKWYNFLIGQIHYGPTSPVIIYSFTFIIMPSSIQENTQYIYI